MATKKTIMMVVGTRPNFIKADPIYNKLVEFGFNVVVVHTGQHYSPTLSKDVLADLELPIHEHFTCQTSNRFVLVPQLEEAIKKHCPHLVMVFGDVNSTFAGAVAAKRNHIPIAHVEAGLRSNNWKMEEELNRYMVDSVSDLLFVTEQCGVDNLQQEFQNKQIGLTGQPAHDTLKRIAPRIAVVDSKLPEIIVTLHRRENLENEAKLREFIKLVSELEGKVKRVGFYAHPHLLKKLKEFKINCPVTLSDPIGYEAFLKSVFNAKLLITDSGGASTEAVLLNTPCAVYRDSHNYEHKSFLRGQLFATQNVIELKHYCSAMLAFSRRKDKQLALSDWTDGKAAERIALLVKEFLHA